MLRAAGWTLVVSDPVEPADVIVVPKWAGEAGALEAAELVRAGIAPRVAILLRPPSAATDQLARRGLIASEDWITHLTRVLGVASVEEIPSRVEGSEAEGEVLPEWCDRNQFRSIVVVTSADHSRRVRRILRRTMKGRPVKVMIRSARYSEFDPDRWWQTRDGVRTEIEELEKLMLDILAHPLS